MVGELDKIVSWARLTSADREWKKEAIALVAEHLEGIRVFRALGLQAIVDLNRQQLVWTHIGYCKKGQNAEEYGFNVWILNELAGAGDLLDDDCIFMICFGCQKLRTQRGMQISPTCRYCAAQRVRPYIGPTETRDNLYRLVRGD